MKSTMFLMTNKGFCVLESLISNGFIEFIDKVIVGFDKNVINDYSNEIIDLCVKYNLSHFLYTEKFKIESRFAIAISWRWIINLNQEKTKLIVLHDSLLPKYRGFSPLVNQLINAEKTIGVTALFATEEYDKGDVISQKRINISYPIKIIKAIEILCLLYSELIVEIFNQLKENEKILFYPQNEELASYSLWRNDSDYFINWNDSSVNIKRFIDSVGFPYQGARFRIDDEVVVVYEVSIVNDLKIESRKENVGKIIFFTNDRPVVVCKSGLLRIDEAVFEKSNNNLFPLKKFRVRFT